MLEPANGVRVVVPIEWFLLPVEAGWRQGESEGGQVWKQRLVLDGVCTRGMVANPLCNRNKQGRQDGGERVRDDTGACEAG